MNQKWTADRVETLYSDLVTDYNTLLDMHNAPAVYLDGEPQNLEAAAADALEWLRHTQEYLLQIHFRDNVQAAGGLQENRRRLDVVIAALTEYLPDVPPIYKSTGEQGEETP